MDHTPTLKINEIFHSIQGESTHAGRPCVFVRLSGCPLRCTYCDTEYAFRGGQARSLSEVLEEVLAIDCELIELTGGEPLAQKAAFILMEKLCEAGRTVLVETSNAIDISPCHHDVIRILDLKTPGSGEFDRNRFENLEDLRPHDEVKFVIVDRRDYDWAKTTIEEYQLAERCHAVLMSPVFDQAQGTEIAGCTGLDPSTLAEWIIADRLPVRMQLQMHKFIWHPLTRGV